MLFTELHKHQLGYKVETGNNRASPLFSLFEGYRRDKRYLILPQMMSNRLSRADCFYDNWPLLVWVGPTQFSSDFQTSDKNLFKQTCICTLAHTVQALISSHLQNAACNTLSSGWDLDRTESHGDLKVQHEPEVTLRTAAAAATATATTRSRRRGQRTVNTQLSLCRCQIATRDTVMRQFIAWNRRESEMRMTRAQST